MIFKSLFVKSYYIVEGKKLRFVRNKEVVPLPGSTLKTLNVAGCPNDCLRECGTTENVAGCSESSEGVCSVVSDGGVLLNDSVGSKAIINGLLLYSCILLDLILASKLAWEIAPITSKYIEKLNNNLLKLENNEASIMIHSKF